MMAEPAFSPEMEKALDAYAVPPIPTGFSDRLMARVASGDTGATDTAPHLPLPRARRSNPWRRTSRIVGSVALFSLATATAAAAGVFGKAVYVPGVSEALIEAKIVEAPAPIVKPKVRMIAEKKAVEPAAAPPPATGSAAIVNRVAELRKDPDFARLTPRQRLAVTGKEVRQIVRSGEASREDVRTAVRELAQNADPATKEAWRKATAERRDNWRERRGLPPVNDGMVAGADGSPAEEALAALKPAQMTPEEMATLRQQYRDATPVERAAIRRALRRHRLEQQSAQQN